MTTAIANEVRQFVTDNFLFRDDRLALDDTSSLLDAGVIDSTGILELVAFIETHFHIVMQDAEIVPENLDSIATIAAFVAGKQAAARVAA